MKMTTGPVLVGALILLVAGGLLGKFAAGGLNEAEVERLEDQRETAKARAAEAEARADSLAVEVAAALEQVRADSARADSVAARLAVVRAQADREVARAAARVRELESRIRPALPEEMRAPFDSLAAENARQLAAKDQVIVQQDSVIQAERTAAESLRAALAATTGEAANLRVALGETQTALTAAEAQLELYEDELGLNRHWLRKAADTALGAAAVYAAAELGKGPAAAVTVVVWEVVLP